MPAPISARLHSSPAKVAGAGRRPSVGRRHRLPAGLAPLGCVLLGIILIVGSTSAGAVDFSNGDFETWAGNSDAESWTIEGGVLTQATGAGNPGNAANIAVTAGSNASLIHQAVEAGPDDRVQATVQIKGDSTAGVAIWLRFMTNDLAQIQPTFTGSRVSASGSFQTISVEASSAHPDTGYVLVIMIMLMMGVLNGSQFIYFQF